MPGTVGLLMRLRLNKDSAPSGHRDCLWHSIPGGSWGCPPGKQLPGFPRPLLAFARVRAGPRGNLEWSEVRPSDDLPATLRGRCGRFKAVSIPPGGNLTLSLPGPQVRVALDIQVGIWRGQRCRPQIVANEVETLTCDQVPIQLRCDGLPIIQSDGFAIDDGIL